MEFVPENAPTAIMVLLLTCLGMLLLGAVFIHALIVRKRHRAKQILVASLAGLGLYSSLLVSMSFRSQERVLEAKELKYFCEMDCHLAYSVLEVSTATVLGTPPNHINPKGTFYLVKLSQWFDKRTISKQRGDMPLKPSRRKITIEDDLGREFDQSSDGQFAFDSTHDNAVSLMQPLKPGDSVQKIIVFDLPNDVRNPRLSITDAGWLSRLLIGHENSPFHKKITFRLETTGLQLVLAVRDSAFISDH